MFIFPSLSRSFLPSLPPFFLPAVFPKRKKKKRFVFLNFQNFGETKILEILQKEIHYSQRPFPQILESSFLSAHSVFSDVPPKSSRAISIKVLSNSTISMNYFIMLIKMHPFFTMLHVLHHLLLLY